MASALLVTYERHQHQNILGRSSSMRKTQKPPKGVYPNDVVFPEFSYPPETVAESDGRRPKAQVLRKTQSFGVAVEQPSETASEDSCSLKRKSMSLNAKDAASSASTFYSFPSKGLSREERRQLRKRLKLELEQVRDICLRLEARELQLKGFSQSVVVPESCSGVFVPRVHNNGSALKLFCEPILSSGTPGFSHREVRSTHQPSLDLSGINPETSGASGKEKRTPKANQLYVNSEFFSGREKVLPVEKLKPKPAAILKRSLQGKGEQRDSKRQKIDVLQSKKLTELMRQCGTILKKLMSHKHAWVFNEPVDVVKLGLHDYLKIIQKPMDLGTVRANLENEKYIHPSEFAEDVRLTFANAMKYNPQGHDVYIMADLLRKLFEDRWKSVEEKLKGLDVDRSIMVEDEEGFQIAKPPLTEVSKTCNMPVEDKVTTAVNRGSRTAPPAKNSTKPKRTIGSLPQRQMTFDEKRTLSKNLESLPADKLEQIVQIIKNRNPDLRQTDDEIEVDIDSFDTQTLWELHVFVVNCNKSKGKIKKTSQKLSNGGDVVELQLPPCEASSTPIPSRRGGECGEEEVDIGDDMPSGSFPPVVIDKDGGVGSKYSSSSSSSSDSGSSSSDSDSGSSSGSDSDADDAQSAGAGSKVSPEKEPVGSDAVRDQRCSSAFQINGAKRSVSEIDEENVSIKASVAGPDSRQEGECGVSERQVSPEKLLRAALLRNRFADTILKAQEKTLPLSKNDRSDPEKLRKEREELERRQKEEKARLQAEAKAAELARKQAEVEAAAEARQRREAEREAARLALQRMEKTVEIDENIEILKDLEMLRTAPPEHIPSSGDETSPVQSPDGLSAFALQSGNNPLEQLGLFMKEDDEEEDQGDQPLLQQQDNADGSTGEEDEEGEIED